MFALKPRTSRAALLPETRTPFAWMPEVINRFFKWPTLDAWDWAHPWWSLTMEEKEKEVIVKAELPGFEPEEVKVELTGELLTVEAEHKEPPKEKGEEKGEREHVHVKREITLPPTVEVEKAEATYRQGVLEVRIPRKPEVVPRRIEVKKT